MSLYMYKDTIINIATKEIYKIDYCGIDDKKIKETLEDMYSETVHKNGIYNEYNEKEIKINKLLFPDIFIVYDGDVDNTYKELYTYGFEIIEKDTIKALIKLWKKDKDHKINPISDHTTYISKYSEVIYPNHKKRDNFIKQIEDNLDKIYNEILIRNIIK